MQANVGNGFNSMDHQILLVINGLAGRYIVLDKIGLFLTDYFLYFALLGVALLWLKKNVRVNVYAALASVLLARGVVVEIIKRLVDRSRPFEILDVHNLAMAEGSGRAFPSGHTAIFFSLAFAFYGTKYFWPFLILATLASIARIYVGVHYPTDVLASIVIAAVMVWLVKTLFKNRVLS